MEHPGCRSAGANRTPDSLILTTRASTVCSAVRHRHRQGETLGAKTLDTHGGQVSYTVRALDAGSPGLGRAGPVGARADRTQVARA